MLMTPRHPHQDWSVAHGPTYNVGCADSSRQNTFDVTVISLTEIWKLDASECHLSEKVVNRACSIRA